MTHEMNQFSEEEQRWLDKLVDGELTSAERRQLLLELETQPDGWRRCALAFLEAQAWKISLGAIAAAPAKDRTPRPAPLNAPPRAFSWDTASWGTVLAAAASFLLAFAMGLAWRGQSERADQAPIAQIKPERPAESPHRSPALGLASDKTQWGTMTVALDRNSDGVSEPLELPVVRGPGIDEDWVRNQPVGIPSQLLRYLERSGHEFQHRRQYYPFDLGDGGHVLVPVDEVDVRNVGQRQFQ